MEYAQDAVRDNLRTQEGRRVFYLAPGDKLSREAAAYLESEGIPVLPPPAGQYQARDGTVLSEKPEEMTSLFGSTLVPKTHPRIAFRGKIDTLEARFLLVQKDFPGWRKPLQELLDYTRYLLKCEVLNTPAEEATLLGRSFEALRRDSQFPQNAFGIAHFMPEATDSALLLRLNDLRTEAREAELAAARCPDLPRGIGTGLNRLSSALYILMLQEKSARRPGTL